MGGEEVSRRLAGVAVDHPGSILFEGFGWGFAVFLDEIKHFISITHHHLLSICSQQAKFPKSDAVLLILLLLLNYSYACKNG